MSRCRIAAVVFGLYIFWLILAFPICGSVPVAGPTAATRRDDPTMRAILKDLYPGYDGLLLPYAVSDAVRSDGARRVGFCATSMKNIRRSKMQP